jgi:hypothetical protein
VRSAADLLDEWGESRESTPVVWVTVLEVEPSVEAQDFHPSLCLNPVWNCFRLGDFAQTDQVGRADEGLVP